MSEPAALLTPSQVRAGRALLAWSQQDLARQAKVGPSTVADFERGSRTPVPNNAEAMRGALESGGVRFYGGGAILEEPPIARPRFLGGQPIRWIEASDLNDWADRRDAQDGLPELISRLLRATYGAAPKLRFPSADSVQHAGWDGMCEAGEAISPAPGGLSVWEIGSQRQGIQGKADEDYRKRTSKPCGVVPEEATYVFVTPRRWAGKVAWAQARRAEGIWADVQVFDADDLVHWLEIYAEVGHWLAARIGKRPPGLRQLSDAFLEWSSATVKPLTADLLLAGRDEQAAEVLRWLKERPRVMTVQAESVEEALAFLHASISELPPAYAEPILARSLIPTSDDAARQAGGGLSALVIGLSAADPGLAQALAAKGHHVYLALGSDGGSPSGVVRLARPLRAELHEALKTLDFTDGEDAERLARDAARSLTVLRRLIPAAPGRMPTWAEAPGASLIAALLAGAWNEGAQGDRDALAQIAGQPYEAVIQDLTPLALRLDGPLRMSEGAWKVASPRDAWFLLAAHAPPAAVQRFVEVATKVLGAVNPKFGEEADEWSSPFEDLEAPHSGLLRHGLTETLILFSLHGDRIVQAPHAAAVGERVVHELLTGAGEGLWWSLSKDFQRLAEAAPQAFLTGLEEALAVTPSPLAILFSKSPGLMHESHFLSEMLWALERLAWSRDLLGRVTGVLAGLDAIDPDREGRLQNRPSNTLRAIFLPWSPQTSATLEERFRVIDTLMRRAPADAWRLLLSIAPKTHDSTSPTDSPQWRDFSVDRPEPVTYPLLAEADRSIGRRLLDLVGADEARWIELLEVYPNFSPHIGGEIRAALDGALGAHPEPAAWSRLRVKLRRLLNHHRLFPDADWVLPSADLDALMALYDRLEPADPIAKVAWLFDDQPAPPDPPGDWQVVESFIEDRRRDVVRDLLAQGGVDAILDLVRAAEAAHDVAKAVVEAETPEDVVQTLLRLSIPSEDSQLGPFGYSLAFGRHHRLGWPATRALLDEAVEAQWGEAALLRILRAAPMERETWNVVAELGPQLEDAYWRGVAVVWFRGEASELVYVAEKLLAVGRARHAVHMLGRRATEGLPGALILRAMEAAVAESRQGPPSNDGNEVNMFGYAVEQLLTQLDADPTVTDDQLAMLEWRYFQVLRFSQRKPGALERAIASDPKLFVSIVKAIYLPAEGSGVVEPDIEDREAAEAVATQAWTLLHHWKRVPGSDEAGAIDGAALEAWMREARILCAESGRAEIGDVRIGDILAAAKPGPDGVWPPTPVREVIEIFRSKELENGIEVGRFNRRGMTSRMPDDGGGLERSLAARYRGWSKAVALEWPRTAALLERLAVTYEADARREDERVERRQWL